MAKIEKIIEELHYLGDRISTQFRTIAVSLIALIWAMLLGSTSNQIGLSVDGKRALVFVGLLALLAMVLDYLQYCFGFVYTDALRNKIEAQEQEEGSYDYSDWRYKMRNGMFWAKQIVLFVAVVWLVVVAKSIIAPMFTRS